MVATFRNMLITTWAEISFNPPTRNIGLCCLSLFILNIRNYPSYLEVISFTINMRTRPALEVKYPSNIRRKKAKNAFIKTS